MKCESCDNGKAIEGGRNCEGCIAAAKESESARIRFELRQQQERKVDVEKHRGKKGRKKS